MSERKQSKEWFPSEEETRTGKRMRMDIRLRYSFDLDTTPSDSSGFRSGTLVNIGPGGLCLRASDTFYIQRLLTVYLKLSHQTSGIKMLGKTVWTAPADDGSVRVGIQFIGHLPSDWQKIVDLSDNETPHPVER